MISKVLLYIVLVCLVLDSFVEGQTQLRIKHPALNQTLFEEVIDAEKCHEQVQFIRNNTMLSLFFADAGIRIPRGILEGNTLDLGNYHQCINFNEPLLNDELQGKYCMIRVPMNQNLHLPEWSKFGSSYFHPPMLSLDEDIVNNLVEYDALRKRTRALSGLVDDTRQIPNNPFSGLELRLAVCIPKPCTTEQAITSLFFNVSAIGFQYTDEFCRLPNDKPWVPGDTVTVVVFSVIGFITLMSTWYDVWQTILLKKDPKTVSVLGRSFSVYTNGRRLMTFNSSPGTIECLDGIRALAMAWVLVGHTLTSEMPWLNQLDTFQWATSWRSVWVVGAHITVDTFFTLSGFLVVYTTVGKLTGMQLLKNIHLFWLHRLLRMFPLLAVAVLLEGTYLNRMTDGPLWDTISEQVQRCRTGWWSTLLHLQNYINPRDNCIGQSWYLAIDVQLHIISPIVLYWVLLGRKRIAWIALIVSVVCILVASTTYNFIMEFPSTLMGGDDWEHYMFGYYVNTLTRGSPFFIGMLFGYIVRNCKLEMSKITVPIFWIAIFTLSTFIMYTNYPIAQIDWDNQLADTLFNSFVRPAWALFLGCLIYACESGYGGPINWLLSLSVWKIHSRLSYAMYLFHFGLMTAVNFSAIAPVYFSIGSVMFKFLSHYALSFAVSFFMVLLIDSPFSTLFKLILGGGVKKPQKKETDIEHTKENNKEV